MSTLSVRVHLHHRQLDHELAQGVDPAASPETAVRARELVDRTTRRRIARMLRRIVADAAGPPDLVSPLPICRGAVAGSGEGLLGLADALERPGPINPSGVARVLELLTDGAGPLYRRSASRSLGDALWWVADGLQLCPPHRWSGPVVMKADPEHTAWTCSRCGSIAMTDDPGMRPAA